MNSQLTGLTPLAAPVLYEDLFALWEAGDLSTGMQYLITDYQTTYLMPHTEEVIICDVEPILVTATSNTTISPIAYSPRYPNDIIFYDIDSERIYEVGGGGSGSGDSSSSGSGDSSGSGSGSGVLSELMQPGASKGYIFRRVDTLNKIDAGFDWRTVRFRRWGIDYEQIPIYDDTTTYQKGDLVRSYDGLNIYVTIKTGVYGNNGLATNNFARLCGSNDIILYKPNDVKLIPFQSNTLNANIANYSDYSFIPKSTDDGSLSNAIKNVHFATNISDIIYRSNTVIIKGSYNIKIGSDCYHNTIGINGNESYDFELADNCVGNTVGGGFVNNNIGKNFKDSVIGSDFMNNTFGNSCSRNTFGDYCTDITFGDGCGDNNFGNRCGSNTFGNNCWSNTFGDGCNNNTFGDNCNDNTFNGYCYSNTFGDGCRVNTFVNTCNDNTFGNSCQFNTFDGYCYSNTFGSSCYNNTFDNYCWSNTFGDGCNNNNFGNYCWSNTFGNYCEFNNFYAGESGTTKKDFIRYIVLEDGCSYNNFYSALTTSDTSYLQRIRIKGLQFTSATDTQITLSAVNTNYEWLICYTSSAVLKQYCPND